MKTDNDREFTQREIDAGVAKLVESIEDGAYWDEYLDYKLPMLDEILNIYLSNLDNSDKLHDIGQVIANGILEWAKFEVVCNPNKYCEFIVPNDDL